VCFLIMLIKQSILCRIAYCGTNIFREIERDRNHQYKVSFTVFYPVL